MLGKHAPYESVDSLIREYKNFENLDTNVGRYLKLLYGNILKHRSNLYQKTSLRI